MVLDRLKFVVFVFLLLLIITLVTVKKYREVNTSNYIDHDIYSSVLQENRTIFVRLPKDYDKDKSYPLIIKSDGNFNLSRWDESLLILSKQHKVKDSIVVAIPNLFWVDSRNRDLVPPYARKEVEIGQRSPEDNAPSIFGQGDLFLEFIETEVLPFIENRYSINDNRVLSGFSAGGSFVLYAIVTKPHLFTGYFAFSPAAWYDNSVVVKEFKKHLPNIIGPPIFLYLSLGSAENEIITSSFNGLLFAIKTSSPSTFYSAYSFSEGAEHTENPSISVPKALIEYYKFRANKTR